MKVLTSEQATVLLAFIEAFDLTTTGAWAPIESEMRENWGIDDPEAALQDVRQALE